MQKIYIRRRTPMFWVDQSFDLQELFTASEAATRGVM